MEEEWMRDRALLRDLLQKTPQASPRELAQTTGRSISWVKKWRKRLTKGDPHDHSVLCSRSRAHHAPYFRWDNRVIQRIVEMRFAPPENLKRIPGPRALLYYLPRDESIARSTGPLATLQSNDLEDPSHQRLPAVSFQRIVPPQRSPRAVGRNPDGCRKMLALSRLSRVHKANVSMWSKSATLSMQALLLSSLPRPERISTNKPLWKRSLPSCASMGARAR